MEALRNRTSGPADALFLSRRTWRRVSSGSFIHSHCDFVMSTQIQQY